MAGRNDPCPCGSGKKWKKCCMIAGRVYTAEQPKHGDVVLHCGHIDAPRMHFGRAPGGLGFLRPDGTDGFSEWVCVCQECFDAADGKIDGVPIRGDGVWQGNEPAVYRPTNPTVN